jgi:hypothetical protein
MATSVIKSLISNFIHTSINLTKMNSNITDVEFAVCIKTGNVCVVKLNFTVGTAITNQTEELFKGLPPAKSPIRTTIRGITPNSTSYARIVASANGSLANAYTPGGIPADQYEGELVYIANQ